MGPTTVLPLGTREMREVLEAAGHTVVGFDDWRRAGVVAVGNDPLFDFARLRAASRARWPAGLRSSPSTSIPGFR